MPHILKRLELNGFKSFAQKTSFEFSDGITAIVGPNGSGKSNIIDAIRWLLGEREAKNLRGGKSEDLIFAGTAKRPRMSQAQASLHFDNKNKFFPVDFPEITISRQVNRDGTSQYFLNKSEIRLKDLIDFFAKARLGSRGLTVISQGNSDMFIQAAPTERREMIEEMLGLREYQIKKEDATRRLKNTQINLDKAKALAEEILPHLRSLKRQTGRWEKREVLEQELKDLENNLFGSEFHELDTHIKTVFEDIDGHKKEFDALVRDRAAAEAKLKKVEDSQPEERKELQAIKAQTQGLLQKRSQLEKELGRLEAQIELGANVPAASGPSHQRLVDFLKNLKLKLESMVHKDAEMLRNTVTEAISEMEDLLIDSTATQAKKHIPVELEAQLKKISANLKDLEKEITSLSEKEKALERSQEQFYHSFKFAVSELEGAKDKVEKWEVKQREREFEKERLALRREEWERQVRQAGRNPNEFLTVKGRGHVSDNERQDMERRMFKLRGDLASIGEVDQSLLKEAKETEDRHAFLSQQSKDLEKAKGDLEALIIDLSEKVKVEFSAALIHINEEFNKFFKLMFSGGHAKLKVVKKSAVKPIAEGEGMESPAVIEAEEDPEDKIEIDVGLPIKKINSINMLSGGEKSLVGIAALFALISVSPPPFLVLDEVDAALDERNARRFAEMLKAFAKKSQFILVTHNRATMEAADILYGITMNEDATSKVVSLKLEG